MNSTRTAAINILVIGGIILVLILLQVIFYTDPVSNRETERQADRSTFSSRTYGLRALYLLLEETGHKVSRLRVPYTELTDHKVESLIIVSPLDYLQPTTEEITAFTSWVSSGGRALIVDRYVQLEIAPEIKIETVMHDEPLPPPQIRQISAITALVHHPRFSEYAAAFKITGGNTITHLGHDAGAALIELQYGDGTIWFLSDPYLLANNGLTQGDNLQLALNLFKAVAPNRQLAFDEYHHGYGARWHNGFVAYFQGTPFFWFIGQLMLMLLLLVYSQGKRFARPLPLKQENRATSLEFVGSMAQLHQLAKATDLALESIYLPFRHRLCRYSGQPLSATGQELARAVARRGKVDETRLELLLRRSDEVLAGAKPGEAELLSLTAEIRDIQKSLSI